MVLGIANRHVRVVKVLDQTGLVKDLLRGVVHVLRVEGGEGLALVLVP